MDPRLRDLVAALSVYREPVDRSALLFVAGPSGGPAPEPDELARLVAAAQAAGLLWLRAGADGADRLALTPRAAAGLAWPAGPDAAGPQARAHRQAAEYWQWRAAVWPQSRQRNLHDLLEARHHLLAVQDLDQACALTESLGAQLHAGAEHDRAASLLREMLAQLPRRAAARRGRLLRQLGTIAEAQADHGEAAGCYREALVLFTEAGDRAGAGGVWHSLGVLAQAGGDYAEAERCFAQATLAEGPQPAGPAQAAAAAAEDPARAPAAARCPGPDGAAAAASPRHDSPAARSPGHGPAAAGSPGPASTARRLAAAPAGPPDSPGAAAGLMLRRLARPRRPDPGRPDPVRRWRARWTGGLRLASRAGRRRAWRGRRGWAAAGLVAAVAGTAAVWGPASAPARLAGPVSLPAAGPAGPGPAADPAAARAAAAAWIARQAGPVAIVACDPAMCAALRAARFPAANLVTLGPAGAADPLGASLVVATAAVRSEFGARLAAVYAPAVLARFGSGSARIDVRVVAPGGSATYLRALRSDRQDRLQAGRELLTGGSVTAAPAAARQLRGGRADGRLLVTLAVLAAAGPVRVISLGGGGPGASPALPLPAATIAGAAGSRAQAAGMLAFLRSQRPPYLAERSALARRGSRWAVTLTFAVPGPLGLLGGGAPKAAAAAPLAAAAR